MSKTLFTIGYAAKKSDEFLSLLKKNGVTCLVDVRSSPYSGTFKEYDKEPLRALLKKNGVLYAHFGSEFGARRDEAEAYRYVYDEKGDFLEQVDFEKVYGLDAFKRGVGRIKTALSQGYRIAFLCSEKDPLNCHRFWMVSHYFAWRLDEGFEIVNLISEKDPNRVFSKGNVAMLTPAFEDFSKKKARFYKEHSSIGQFDLYGQEMADECEKWWDSFYRNNPEGEVESLFKYRNLLIGYKKGGLNED